MPVNQAIQNRIASYQVEVYGGDTTIKGVLQPNLAAAVSKDLAIFPVGTRDLIALPEGMYTMEDIKIYELGSPTIPIKSIVIYTSKRYEVSGVSDREKDGDFTWYFAKKQDDNR